MKKVLLVNNHTYYLKNLRQLILKSLPNSEITQIKREEIVDTAFDDFDLIILSGGTGKAVVTARKFYEPLRKIITTASTPIVGVCLGAELIADSFGAELTRMKVKRYRNVPIYFVKKTKIDPGKSPIFVYQAHKWKIRRLPEALECLAVSKDGVEIFRHHTKIIYGVQFHPEVAEPHSDGAEIFTSIVRSIQRNFLNKK